MPANGEIDEKAGSQFNLLARDMFTQKGHSPAEYREMAEDCNIKHVL